MTDDITDWSLKLDNLGDQGLGQLLEEQWKEANMQFTRFIETNYENWMHIDEKPLMSPEIISSRIKKNLDNNEKEQINNSIKAVKELYESAKAIDKDLI